MLRRLEYNGWHAAIALAAGLAVAMYFWQPILPSLSRILSYGPQLNLDLGSWGVAVEGSFINRNVAFINGKIAVSNPIEMAERLQTTLKEMSDDELVRISVAERPCKNRLIDCRGFSDIYAVSLAAAERQNRADRAAKAIQVRDQNSKDMATEAAMKSAEANMISARAAERNANNAWLAALASGIGAGAALATIIFGVFTWWYTKGSNTGGGPRQQLSESAHRQNETVQHAEAEPARPNQRPKI